MPYSQLTRGQRCRVEALKASGFTQAQIAERVGVHQSTISRELGRNGPESRFCGHRADLAAAKALLRRRRPPPRIKDPVWNEVERLLIERDWSPQRISRRLLAEQGVRVSHESICGRLLQDKRNGGGLFRHPPCAGRRRKRMGAAERRGRIPNRQPIQVRPKAADDRSREGDWECDTVVGAKRKGVLATAAERRSRFFAAAYAGRRTKDAVRGALRRCLAPHKSFCRSLTFDNGLEFAGHPEVGSALGAETFLADPHSSWRRGTNERLNGRLRRCFPKGTALTSVTDGEIQAALDKINSKPMKVLGWRTPHEACYGMSQTLTRICT